jgi:drug/metabolite transporter (DMT)-like permease
LSSWWQTARKILSGKPRGSKLIVLGVFLASIGVVLTLMCPQNYGAPSVFLMLGIIAFMRGISLYEAEVEAELEKERNKEN